MYLRLLCFVLGASLFVGGLAEAAMRVKVELLRQELTTGQSFRFKLKVTLYMQDGTAVEHGLARDFNAANTTTQAAALTFLRNEAIDFATAHGMSPAPVAGEVWIFGGPQ